MFVYLLFHVYSIRTVFRRDKNSHNEESQVSKFRGFPFCRGSPLKIKIVIRSDTRVSRLSPCDLGASLSTVKETPTQRPFILGNIC